MSAGRRSLDGDTGTTPVRHSERASFDDTTETITVPLLAESDRVRALDELKTRRSGTSFDSS
jgi:hypothetical protein